MSEPTGSPEDISAAPARRLLSEAPRRFPEGLSGQLVKGFAKLAGIGVAVALVFLLIGLFMEDSYREMQEMRYYGEYIEAIAGAPQTDEDGSWATVVYTYAGQQHQADIDITDETYNRIVSAPGGMMTLPIVIWPEAPTDAVAVEWIDAQGGFWEFAWAYWLGLLILLFAMLFAAVHALRLRRRFVHGVEVWGEPTDSVSFDPQKGQFETTVRFDREVSGSDAATVRWPRGRDPVTDDRNRVLLLVDPSNTDRTHVLDRGELEAIQTGV